MTDLTERQKHILAVLASVKPHTWLSRPGLQILFFQIQGKPKGTYFDFQPWSCGPRDPDLGNEMSVLWDQGLISQSEYGSRGPTLFCTSRKGLDRGQVLAERLSQTEISRIQTLSAQMDDSRKETFRLGWVKILREIISRYPVMGTNLLFQNQNPA